MKQPSNELLRFSRDMLAKGSQSFARATKLFDAKTRDNVTLLYAWCRYCDDAIDGQKLGHEQKILPQEIKKQRIVYLENQTKLAFQNKADTLPFQALAYVVKTYDIDICHPLDLLQGFAMDAEERIFESIDDTMLYSYYVAGVVGLMMAQIMGVKSANILERAVDLGLAFQLTNIARDVVEDAKSGRIFLPLSWLRDAGLPVKPDELLQLEHNQSLKKVATQLINYAEPYYQSAYYGIAELPYRSAWAIASAHAIYRDIGVRIKQKQDLKGRISTSRQRKLWHVSRSSFLAGKAVTTRPNIHPERADLWKRVG